IRSRPFGTTFCPSRLRLKTADQHGSKRTSEVVEGISRQRGIFRIGCANPAQSDGRNGAASHAGYRMGGCASVSGRVASIETHAGGSEGILRGERIGTRMRLPFSPLFVSAAGQPFF